MSNQLVITSGAKVRSLNGVITGTTGVLDSLPINAANGIPQLDSSGKILVSQLPNSVMEYKGTWNAATNTPTLADGTGNQGDVYLCNVAGTVNFGAGPISFVVGDQVIYSGTIWQRASGSTGTVTSVAVTESGDALSITGSPITTSGTINIGFAGTSAQYVAGDGSLITFPTTATAAQNLITEVYNETGATLTKGTVVYINGGHGNLPTVTKAIATGDSTSAQTYGVVRADITNMNNGFVTVIGSLSDLDTQAYAAGTQLYLSSTTAGAWTSVKQYAPAHLVYVGIVVRSHPTQGVVEIRIQNGFELDELHNVSAQTPSNNDGIFYNSSNSLWEAKSIASALGYTPANDSLVVHLAGNETITGVKTFSTQQKFDLGLAIKEGTSGTLTGYTVLGANVNQLLVGVVGATQSLTFPSSSSYTYTFPSATGTLALTSDIPSLTGYVTGTGTSGQVSYFNGTSTITGSNNFKFDGTNLTVGNPSSALAQLHVYNASAAATILLQTNSTTDYSEIAVRNDSSTATSYFRQYSTAATGSDFGISRAGLALFFSNYATNFAIGTRNGGNLIFGTADTERARINTSGNFGIGLSTIDNNYKLIVRRSTNVNIGFGIQGGEASIESFNDAVNAGMPLRIYGSTLSFFGAATFSSSVTASNFYAISSSEIRLYNSNNTNWGTIKGSTDSTNGYITLTGGSGNGMIVANSGNVGIGTTSPTSPLHVGTATSGNQKIQQWGEPGFVDNYGLILRGSSLDGVFKFYGLNNGTETSSPILSMNRSSGNVGIGTSSPNALLQVNGSSIIGSGTISNGTTFGGGNQINRLKIETGAYTCLEINGAGSGGSIQFTYGSNAPNQVSGLIGYNYASGAANEFVISNVLNGAMIIGTNNTERMRILATGQVNPGADNSYGFGGSGIRWAVIWAANGTIQTSDRREKKDITNTDLGLNLINKLRPVSFKWIVGHNEVSTKTVIDENGNEKTEQVITPREGKRKHYGLIAQEVKEALGENDFGGFIEDEKTGIMGLRYDQFVPILIKARQEQQKQIEELKAKIK